jgi:hypothetical protein
LFGLEDKLVDASDLDLGLFSKSAGQKGFRLGSIAGLNPETLNSLAREEVILAVDRVRKVLGLVGVEEELDLFLDRSADKIVFTDLDFPSDIFFGLDQINLKLKVGKGSLHLIIEFIGLDEDGLRRLVNTKILPDIETHANLSLLNGFMECTLEDLAIDEHVDDFIGVFG